MMTISIWNTYQFSNYLSSADTVYCNFSKIVLSQPKKSLGMNGVLEWYIKMPGSLTNNIAALLMLTAIKQIWVVKIAIHMVKFLGHSKYILQFTFQGPQNQISPREAPRSHQ